MKYLLILLITMNCFSIDYYTNVNISNTKFKSLSPYYGNNYLSDGTETDIKLSLNCFDDLLDASPDELTTALLLSAGWKGGNRYVSLGYNGLTLGDTFYTAVMKLPNTSLSFSGGAFTVSLWFSPYSDQLTPSGGIFTKDNALIGGTSRCWYIAYSGNKLAFYTWKSTTIKQCVAPSIIPHYAGKWYMVTAVYEPSTRMELYLNGQSLTTLTTTIHTNINTANVSPLVSGVWANSGETSYTAGFYKRVKFIQAYSKAFSDEEVLALYEEQKPGLTVEVSHGLTKEVSGNFDEQHIQVMGEMTADTLIGNLLPYMTDEVSVWDENNDRLHRDGNFIIYGNVRLKGVKNVYTVTAD